MLGGTSTNSIARISGLSESDSRCCLDAIVMRKRLLYWAPGVAGLAVFFGWMIAFGKITDAVEGTRWDVLAFGESNRSFVHGTAAILVGYGIAVTLGVVVCKLLSRHLR